MEDASRRLLLFRVLPLWVVPGLADWWMHRRVRIEHTSGTEESAFHAQMMTEAGVLAEGLGINAESLWTWVRKKSGPGCERRTSG